MSDLIVPIPPKLIQVFAPERGAVRYRWACGGRSSGKSFTFAMMAAIWGACEKLKILVGRGHFITIKDSFFAELKNAIESNEWLASQYDVGEDYLRGYNGTQFLFRGLNVNPKSIKSIAHVDLCILEEAEAVSEQAWLNLEPTIRAHKSEIWCIWNPEREDSPVDIRMVQNKPDNSVGCAMNYTDNPWFTNVMEAQRLRDLQILDRGTYNNIWLGEYLKNSEGDYYRNEFARIDAEGRICNVSIMDNPVFTFWDIGNSDGTAIWFIQKVGLEVRCIDYFEAHDEKLGHYAAMLKEKGYNYAKHFLPHDADYKKLSDSNKSTREMLEDLGVKDIEVLPRITTLFQGIEITRRHFPALWFDKTRCALGIKRLRNYRKRWSKTDNRFVDEPDKKNGSSEAADAIRQWAQAEDLGLVGIRERSIYRPPRQDWRA